MIIKLDISEKESVLLKCLSPGFAYSHRCVFCLLNLFILCVVIDVTFLRRLLAFILA